MALTRALLMLGGSIFAVLGFLHALYTFLDIRTPRRLVPDDPSIAAAMATSNLRLTRGRTTMWKAWVGFNFSHSVGAILLGGLSIAAGTTLQMFRLPAWVLLLFAVIGALYLVLAVLYWFRIPIAGIAIATACFLAAWFLYVFGGNAATAPEHDGLHDTVAALDTAVFDAFNHCSEPGQLDKHASYFAVDVEFYHDSDGVTWTREDVIASTRKYVCGKFRRERGADSLRVYPIKGFGAIAQGSHRFCQFSSDTCEGMADFTMIWREQNGKWEITRALSYGHRPASEP